ncbi:lipase family protein [Guptibacillus spartinae]|uniref:lipase family protein n=1 Tax=Guptibacillus spartinae TaxID=3025679 RepID=UPI002362C9CD|nr:hypothetical protein [Pseudalkalibacillus spartinae]
MIKLRDYEAAYISFTSYSPLKKILRIRNVNGEISTWKRVDTITDVDTGLQGFVIQNVYTDEVVISFRGTEMPTSEKNEIKSKYVGSPYQDALLASGEAEIKNGDITYKKKSVNPASIQEADKDVTEDVEGIILGDSNYTKKRYGTTAYLGTPSQDASLSSGQAELDAKAGTITYIHKNQFTEAKEKVDKYVEKFGAKNITFVGHSLGGGLAQYFAITNDSNSVTFAAADIYSLLTPELQKRVDNGEFKDNSISYTFPDDVVGTHFKQSTGSVYYMSDPSQSGMPWIESHGITNYLSEKLYDEDGYFVPEVLYDEYIQAQVTTSPLALKNSGVSDFHIKIQESLMKGYVQEMKQSEEQIEATKQALVAFLDTYMNKMRDIKSKYLNAVGSGRFDKLSEADVEGNFQEFTKPPEDGVPMLFDIKTFDSLMTALGDTHQDTSDIAFNMERMSNDLERADQLLAQWLRYES